MTVVVFSPAPVPLGNHDGVALAQRELRIALGAVRGITQVSGDEGILWPHAYLTSLSSEDSVYCNYDPYAYLLYAAREELGANFRIVRNVQAGAWSGYLLQECLCRALTRDSDAVLYISEYARTAYETWLSAVGAGGKAFVCYPEALAFPRTLPRSCCSPTYACGYIGRVSRDKGFEVVLEVFSLLAERDPRARFLLAGAVHPLDYSSGHVSKELGSLGLAARTDAFGMVDHGRVFSLMSSCEALIFPSTSNVESLGRVLIEAAHAAVPVVAARHAAAPELLRPEALVDSRYRRGTTWDPCMHVPLGQPSGKDMVDLIADGLPSVPQGVVEARMLHWDRLLSLLFTGDPSRSEDLEFAGLDGVELGVVSGVPVLGRLEALDAAIRLREALKDLMAGGDRSRDRLDELERFTRQRQRTARFACQVDASGLDLSDIGGAPIELCHLARFWPSFTL